MRRRVTQEDLAEATRLLGGRLSPSNWWVCDGYEIHGEEIVPKHPAPMFVVPDGSPDFELQSHWRVYDPLKEAPDLFLKIASLYDEPDFPAAALTFCRKYGVPGGSSVEAGGRPDVTEIPLFFKEAKRARDILDLYEATLNEDFDTMTSFLSAPPAAWKEYFEQDAFEEFFSQREVVDLVLKTRRGRGSVTLITLLLVSSAVDHTLRTLCHLGASLKLKGLLFEHPPSLESCWNFDNLLGAAYLQMHWLMTSGDELARCEYCGRVLSLARPHPEGRKRRQDKRFCDDACRQAHHRAKKRS